MDSNTSDLTSTLYQKVPADGPDSIRLIHLLPGGLRDELQCTVTSADLTTNPKFEALSYVWGAPIFDATIICNEHIPFKITKSLHTALVRLRDTNGIRIFWIDQICINQASNADRSAQVARMTRIYSQCQNLVVWLGDGPPNLQGGLVKTLQTLAAAQTKQSSEGLTEGAKGPSKLPLSDMNTVQRERYGLPGNTDIAWKIMLYLYASEWMRRTWIVQEIALPKRVDVQIGPVIMDWLSFSAILVYVESLKVMGMNYSYLSSWKSFIAVTATRTRAQLNAKTNLMELLFVHRRCKATDPRDRIYGIMGLAKEHAELPPADYEFVAKALFINTTVNMIHRAKNLDILGLVGPPGPSRPADLPSWVPDYGSPGGPHPVTRLGSIYTTSTPQTAAKFAASANSKVQWMSNGAVLIVKASIIGEIHELASHWMSEINEEVDLNQSMFKANLDFSIRTFKDGLAATDTSLAWDTILRSTKRRSSTYEQTGESTEDAFLNTYYEGGLESITDEIRSTNALERRALTIWRVLTLGRGGSWLPLATLHFMMFAFTMWFIGIVYYYFGLIPVPLSTMQKFTDLVRDSMERRLFTATNGLIGLAPPNSLPGDKISILLGGRVPVILRQRGNAFVFVGEAYVHGAMYGEMFDASALSKIQII